MTAGNYARTIRSSFEGIAPGTPPCEVLRHEQGRKPCGKPSAYRVFSLCPGCGPARPFICAGCLGDILASGATCSKCASPRGIDGYC